MNVKELLLKQSSEAFGGGAWMSLMGAINDLTEKEARWRPNDRTWTVEEILYHVAEAKLRYAQEGFGAGEGAQEKPLGDLGAVIALLERAQETLWGCLEGIVEADLDKPIPTTYHGDSAAHFFWIMIAHDLSHAAQIRALRRAYGTRTGFYAIG